jgi:hypothetical protein
VSELGRVERLHVSSRGVYDAGAFALTGREARDGSIHRQRPFRVQPKAPRLVYVDAAAVAVVGANAVTVERFKRVEVLAACPAEVH